MDMRIRHRGAAEHRLLPLVLGLAALLLGLLGMHTLAVDHQMPGTPPGHSAAAAAPDTHQTLVPAGQHLSAAPAPAPDNAGSCSQDCAMEMAMAGICVLALAAGLVFVHRAARATLPVPGRGLAAPPAHWIPHPHTPPGPSLVQLSISRT